MKPALLVISLFTALCSFSQDSTVVEQYCIVDAISTLRNNQFEVLADYGQKMRRGLSKRNLLKDDSGKRKTFRSEVDALNFFGAEGWILVNAFPVISGTSSNTRYIFKRTVPANEENPDSKASLNN